MSQSRKHVVRKLTILKIQKQLELALLRNQQSGGRTLHDAAVMALKTRCKAVNKVHRGMINMAT